MLLALPGAPAIFPAFVLHGFPPPGPPERRFLESRIVFTIGKALPITSEKALSRRPRLDRSCRRARGDAEDAGSGGPPMKNHLLLWMTLLSVFVEIAILRFRGRRYPWSNSLASIGVAAGHYLSLSLNGAFLVGVYRFVWDHRLATQEMRGAQPWLVLFVVVEFVYYWEHRLSHAVRLLWATHAVHHSSEAMVFTSAYRLGWTQLLSAMWIMLLPLVWLGYPPRSVLTVLAVDLVCQFWLHTELIGGLGPLEYVLNTPRHHRLHHSMQIEHIDRNFGGVLIVFDRIFGTVCDSAVDPSGYGIRGCSPSHNPFVIVFTPWLELFLNLREARGVRRFLWTLFGPPAPQTTHNGTR